MYNVARKRFDEIFSDTSLYDTIRRPVDKISYYEYDVIEKGTRNIVGYFTETSYENTYKVVKRLMTDDDISYHFNKIREYIDILESSAKRKYTPSEGAGVFEFLDENNIAAYDISSGADFAVSFGEALQEMAEKRKVEMLERATYERLSEFEANLENVFMTYYFDGNKYELVKKQDEYVIRVNGDERTSTSHKETILGLFRGCIEQREQVLKLLSLKIE